MGVRAAGRRLGPPRTATVVAAGVVGLALAIGLTPIHDNSFLTHLATGRWVVRHGFPRRDLFLAAPDPSATFVLQSWVPSVLYGAVDAVAGERGLQVLMGATTAGVGAVVVALARPCRSVVAHLVLVAASLAVGLDQWAPRPLLFGLIGLGLCVLAADGRLRPGWMVPVMAAWAACHGSFPLGLALLALLALGRRLDGANAGVEARALAWACAGTALGAVGPYGPALLVFPARLLARREQLSTIKEWRPPGLSEPATLCLAALAVAVAATLARRWSWRVALPAVAFVALAALSARNVAPAAVVLVGLAAPSLSLGTLSMPERVPAVALGAVAALAVALGYSSLAAGTFRLDAYPVEVLAAWRASHAGEASLPLLVAPDYVGNLREAQEGPTGTVWLDDRVELQTVAVVHAYGVLVRGEPGWDGVLAATGAGEVVWRLDEPLGRLLADDPAWVVRHRGGRWALFART